MNKTKSILAVLLSVLFIFFAVASGDSSDSTSDQGKGTAQTTKKDNTQLGEFSVEISSCRLAKDFEGKDVVIIKYNFKNNTNENATSFWVAFDDNVYQNGVGLNNAYVLADDANYSEDNQTKEIKKGASLEVEVAYELNDTTTDIEVEVAELFSFDDAKITKTFKIADAE